MLFSYIALTKLIVPSFDIWSSLSSVLHMTIPDSESFLSMNELDGKGGIWWVGKEGVVSEEISVYFPKIWSSFLEPDALQLRKEMEGMEHDSAL